MSGGAFRDASAALERAAVLEQENQSLHEELVKLRAEVESLRAALEGEAPSKPPEDEARRVREERDELLREVKETDRLRTQLAAEHEAQRALRLDRNRANAEANGLSGDLYSARHEVERLREELKEVRREADKAREDAALPVVSPNKDAYLQRVQEERDELLREVRELRAAKSQAPRPSLLAGLFKRR